MEKKLNITSTLAQTCYEQLQNDIITGILRPGEKLKVMHLKDRLQAGQSPVREALSRLAASGLVETEDNKGFRVAMVSEADVRDTYATFTHIENLALQEAIKNGDDTWKAGIIAALYKLSLIEHQKKPVSYKEWVERNYEFHVALISGCGSPKLLQIRHDLYLQFDRYCRIAFTVSKDELSVNNEEHQKLADVVLARDAPGARKLMTYHINGALEDVIAMLRKNEMI